MKAHWIIYLSLVLLSLAGCSSEIALARADGSRASTQTPQAGTATVTRDARPQVRLPLGLEANGIVNMARHDLAGRLEVAPQDIQIASVISQEFSTQAFYCLKTQGRIAKDDPPAAISGFSILLNVSGRRYEYHASGQTVIFCRPLD